MGFFEKTHEQIMEEIRNMGPNSEEVMGYYLMFRHQGCSPATASVYAMGEFRRQREGYQTGKWSPANKQKKDRR